MSAARRTAPYPWQTLERVPRAVARRSTDLRRRLERAISLSRLGAALGELVGSDVSIALRDLRPAETLRQRHPCRVAFVTASGGCEIVVELEMPLATALLARLLGRSVSLGPSGVPLDPALSGALGALGVEAARRSGAGEPLRAVAGATPPSGAIAAVATVLLDGRPYEACAIGTTSAAPIDPPELRDLGDLALELRLVVGLASSDPRSLASLQPGDAWLAEAGWWIDRTLGGRALLAAPGGEGGVAVELRRDGAMVVGGFERIATEVETMTEDIGDPLPNVALDAPLVVRVELGAVSMTARQWAELRPGDVIETGRRIAEPVTLRVAGQVVARGELVDVEGELGVRIRELFGRAEGA
jgi:type III secretion system YscQ/HrcQ family protein